MPRALIMATSLAEPRIRPTSAALGADVEGVDMSSGDAGVAVIERALRERLVIRLRGYDLDDVEFTRLAERFGDLEGSPDFSKSRDVYIAASPKMTVVSNVTVDGKPVGDHGDGELNWHTDQGFVERPSGYTFLLAREVPPTGGNTSFANMYAAYERLDEDVKKAIARLKIKHQESHTAQGIPRPGIATSGRATRASCRVRNIRSCARIRSADARRCTWDGALALTSRASRSPIAKRCSTFCGTTLRAPKTFGRKSGRSAISSCGTTAARCTDVTPSPAREGGACIGSRRWASGRSDAGGSRRIRGRKRFSGVRPAPRRNRSRAALPIDHTRGIPEGLQAPAGGRARHALRRIAAGDP
jgi:hypothetical protein